jgi:nitroreductase
MNIKINLKEKIKNIIPLFVKIFLLKFRVRVLIASVWFFSRSRFLASLYYCFFNRQFAREHQSVLKGRLVYLQEKGANKNSSTLLRRNIHRIEKGLIMRPKKKIFALNYIQETVRAFHIACNNDTHDAQELKWARDILTMYFSVVKLNLLNPAIKKMFDSANGSRSDIDIDDEESSIPYYFFNKKKSQITTKQFLALCIQRRSVRWFEQKMVARSLLEQAIEIASLAPSACNRQPYQFHIANDKILSQKLINIPLGTKGFGQNVPCTIVVTADLGYYPTERDRHLIYIDSTLASMQLMLALETLGLSSCPINWPDIEDKEQQMASLLELADTVRPIMLIAVGYGLVDGKIPYSQKKSGGQLINYINP